MSFVRSITTAAALAGLVACGGGDGPPAARRPVTPLDPATTGVIEGTVRFVGTPPPQKTVAMSGECAALHPGPVLAGDVLVEDGRVQNAFVYLKKGLGDRVFAVPTEAVIVDQRGCLYHPRVTGAQTGQPIVFLNSDALLHNVHGTPAHASHWNFSMAVKNSRRTIQVNQPEVMVSVRCDVHPWMQAWLGVVDHPYFAVTGADGTFHLRDVPAGDYVVAAWHERFGTREARVTLAAQGTQQVELTFGAP